MNDLPVIKSSKTIITPQIKTHLGCNGFINEYYANVDDDIEINCLYLSEGHKNIFIMSVDSLFVSEKLRTIFLKDLEKYAIKNEEFLFSATHTHYAPMLDETKPKLGRVHPDHIRFVIDQARKLIRVTMNQTEQVCNVYIQEELIDNSINRRRNALALDTKFPFLKLKSFLMPNKKGKVNKNIQTIVFKNKEDDIISIIWNYACHPVIYPNSKNVTAHYPGVVRKYLREILNKKDLPIMFLQGFTGDIRPKVVQKITTLKDICKCIRYFGLSFGSFTQDEYNTWTNQLARKVLLCINKKADKLNINLNSKIHTISLNSIVENTENNLDFQLIKLNNDNIFFAISAEVVSEYEDVILKFLENKNIIFVGCINNVFGYLPTKEMIGYEGYEVQGFMPAFNLHGKFKKNCETVIVESIKNLVCCMFIQKKT
ncbi:MAG: hypothetical protein GY817_05990 [bacterium]|nr:hypothetical protein [bacterium]